MATSKKPLSDREAGEIMLNEVFAVVQRLNAAAGPAMVQKGTRSGNMTFNPRIVVDESGSKHYMCFVDIYTQGSSKAGTDMSMEWSSTNTEQFKQALNSPLSCTFSSCQRGLSFRYVHRWADLKRWRRD